MAAAPAPLGLDPDLLGPDARVREPEELLILAVVEHAVRDFRRPPGSPAHKSARKFLFGTSWFTWAAGLLGLDPAPIRAALLARERSDLDP